MKHAIHLALASMAAFVAGSVQAGSYGTFSINFDDMTPDQAPSSPAATVGTWALNADDEGTVVTTNGNSNADYLLSLACATNTPVVFTPTNDTNFLEMDVNFVGASEAQIPEAGSQVGLYLDVSSTPVLKLSVNGGAFVDFTDDTSGNPVSVTEGAWYKVVMEFDYTTPKTVVSIYDGNTLLGKKTTTLVSTAYTKVNSVNFCGTGLVDNFVGKWAFDSATTASDDEHASDSDVAMTYSGSTLTPEFATSNGNGALKFIKVTDVDGTTHTLRYTGSQAFNTTGLGKVAKVVAYYGNNVSATDGVDVDTTPTVDNGEVSGSVTAASGLYYAIEMNGVKTALNDNNPVAPQNDGTPLNYSVDASTSPYGVVKFKIVASDDPVSQQ